ncbi:hypothetical protein COU74_03060 [Candidatus Peregrinibacteria bacterium CG10_big_fil_rev_8_21_14_0_10_36_19]|nr:MAG: hypothetical protein COU74_03060 [Candidatus Peregrinibacteria bacterium CG10_big_fil_rev_8_21_14_0_10_36_19]
MSDKAPNSLPNNSLDRGRNVPNRRAEAQKAAKEQREAMKPSREVFVKNTGFALGSAELPKGAKTIENLDKYEGVVLWGGADKTTFTEKPKSDQWYKKMVNVAKEYKKIRDLGKLRVNLSGEDKDAVNKVIDMLASQDATKINATSWKSQIEGINKENIYGSMGAYNALVAFERALIKKRGQMRNLSEKDFKPENFISNAKVERVELVLNDKKANGLYRNQTIEGVKITDSERARREILLSHSEERDKAFRDAKEKANRKLNEMIDFYESDLRDGLKSHPWAQIRKSSDSPSLTVVDGRNGKTVGKVEVRREKSGEVVFYAHQSQGGPKKFAIPADLVSADGIWGKEQNVKYIELSRAVTQHVVDGFKAYNENEDALRVEAIKEWKENVQKFFDTVQLSAEKEGVKMYFTEDKGTTTPNDKDTYTAEIIYAGTTRFLDIKIDAANKRAIIKDAKSKKEVGQLLVEISNPNSFAKKLIEIAKNIQGAKAEVPKAPKNVDPVILASNPNVTEVAGIVREQERQEDLRNEKAFDDAVKSVANKYAQNGVEWKKGEISIKGETILFYSYDAKTKKFDLGEAQVENSKLKTFNSINSAIRAIEDVLTKVLSGQRPMENINKEAEKALDSAKTSLYMKELLPRVNTILDRSKDAKDLKFSARVKGSSVQILDSKGNVVLEKNAKNFADQGEFLIAMMDSVNSTASKAREEAIMNQAEKEFKQAAVDDKLDALIKKARKNGKSS